MLASFPASMLNQNTPDLGILNRLKLDPSRSSSLLKNPETENFGILAGRCGGEAAEWM
jgi:hypothetical protein